VEGAEKMDRTMNGVAEMLQQFADHPGVLKGPRADGIKGNIYTTDGKSFDIPQGPRLPPTPPLNF